MKHRRIAAFIIALLCIAALSGSVLSQQRPLRNRLQSLIPSDVEIIRDVEYGKGGDVSLKLDIVRPKEQPKNPMPVVVFIHGGGWQKGDKQSGIGKLVPLARKGYFGATINYRLTDIAPFPAQAGSSPRRWMSPNRPVRRPISRKAIPRSSSATARMICLSRSARARSSTTR
ncbi:MAG: alpha/beta hydrolase [Armatimonadetes bacterium]|nr:alpha/beta hydrolase [Armatimonadota bacterium]